MLLMVVDEWPLLQARWSFKQLVEETDQPAQWLKQVLEEVAIFNQRGPNAKLYELKREYRTGGGNHIDADMTDA